MIVPNAFISSNRCQLGVNVGLSAWGVSFARLPVLARASLSPFKKIPKLQPLRVQLSWAPDALQPRPSCWLLVSLFPQSIEITRSFKDEILYTNNPTPSISWRTSINSRITLILHTLHCTSHTHSDQSLKNQRKTWMDTTFWWQWL